MLYIYINSNYKAGIDTEATLDSTSTFFSHFVSGSVFYKRWIYVCPRSADTCEVRMIRKSSSILTVSHK